MGRTWTKLAKVEVDHDAADGTRGEQIREKIIHFDMYRARRKAPVSITPEGRRESDFFSLRVLIPTKDDDTIWFLIIFAMPVCRTRKGREGERAGGGIFMFGDYRRRDGDGVRDVRETYPDCKKYVPSRDSVGSCGPLRASARGEVGVFGLGYAP
jgi:hypothetical protein